MRIGPRHRTPAERAEHFWSKTVRVEDCLIWTDCKGPTGYGRFWDGTKAVRAHRWAWEQVNGPMPSHLFAMHSCDTPSCVNPLHISPGTAQDNSNDAVRKGRTRSGVKPGRVTKTTKLTDEQASRIMERYANGERVVDLAQEFSVVRSLIYQIISGSSRRHLHRPRSLAPGVLELIDREVRR